MSYIPFNYFTISLLLGAFTALISGFVVISHDYKRLENQTWFALTMSTAIWSSAYFYMTIAPTRHDGLLGNWILHYAAIFIPLFYYVLVLIITNTLSLHKNRLVFYSVIAFIFTLVNPLSIFVSDVTPKVGFNFAPVPGPLYVFFFLYFVALVLDGLVTTVIAIKENKDKAKKARLVYTMIFTILASVGGGSVFATTFLGFIPPYPLILFSLYPAISGYAVLRYQLFDVKVVTAQIFTFTLWIFIFIRILFSGSFQEEMTNIVLLIFTIIFGLLLNRSVKREVRQRERIELLASEQENLIHIISHQIKGYLSKSRSIFAELMSEPAYGPVSDSAKVMINEGFTSLTEGVEFTGQLLNTASVEKGTMQFNMKNFDVTPIVKETVKNCTEVASKKNLTLTFAGEDRVSNVFGDMLQIKEVIKNLIDNSIHYTNSGSVTVSMSQDAKVARIVVKDTGIGLAPDDMAKLFTKGGRGKDSLKINVNSTGYGLFFVKKVVDAHKGKVWAESQGPGKGSIFIVELPKGNS